jgi:hypothetical protein
MDHTAGFQSFRMRTFKVKGHCRCHKNVNSFEVLNSLNIMVQRLRPKAFLPVRLSRFLGLVPLIPLRLNLAGERVEALG